MAGSFTSFIQNFSHPLTAELVQCQLVVIRWFKSRRKAISGRGFFCFWPKVKASCLQALLVWLQASWWAIEAGAGSSGVPVLYLFGDYEYESSMNSRNSSGLNRASYKSRKIEALFKLPEHPRPATKTAVWVLAHASVKLRITKRPNAQCTACIF